MMADVITDIPLPSVTIQHINKNAEIIESGKVPENCMPYPDLDKCESAFPRLSDEENLMWRDNNHNLISYLITDYTLDKNINLIHVVCNHLICEILLEFNSKNMPIIAVDEIHAEWSKLVFHIKNQGNLNTVDVDLGIRPHGNSSDNIWYQYFFLVFES